MPIRIASLAFCASLALLAPALAQEEASSRSGGNSSSSTPSQPNASDGTTQAPAATGSVTTPRGASGADAASSPLNSGNADQPSRAVPNTGSTTGGPAR